MRTTKVIGLVLIGLSILVFAFCLYYFALSFSDYGVKEVTVPCYDRAYNQIEGLQCKSYQSSNDYFGVSISLMILAGIIFVLGYELTKEEHHG